MFKRSKHKTKDCENREQIWTFGIIAVIEMFGFQGSPSSPTDPLFRQLSQKCPIRVLAVQTQRLLLARNLQALKTEAEEREKQI